MKVALYSPYLDTLGGGERYMMTIAETLLPGNKVDILLDSHLYLMDTDKLISEICRRFGLDLKGINLVRAPFGKDSNSLERTLFLMKYDLLFYLTDGSIFYPTSTKNILHIQSPIIGQSAKSLFGKLKLSGWDLIIYNSKFTEQNSKNNWKIKSEVIYPPIDIESIKVLDKKKYILSVGRFFSFLRDKKQEVLIKAFKDIHKKIPGWSLILVGSASEGDRKYVEELKELSENLPIKILTNLEYKELLKIYGESSIYWHAMGFEEEDPTKMEHFGISTVEAMAAGCVPIVVNKGGQVEIVEKGVSGVLWDSLDDLKEQTLRLVENSSLREKMSKEAIKRVMQFSKEKFKDKILEL